MIIAKAGEEIKGRDGKVIATVAQDIHSGDVNVRPEQFTLADGNHTGGFLPEEVYDFIRDRLSSPPQEKAEKAEAPAAKPKPAKRAPKGKRK